MSTRVDLRSMIHNDIINKLLNSPHTLNAVRKTSATGAIGNEMTENKFSFSKNSTETHSYKLVQRSLREYKLLTHTLGLALIIMTLATSALWVWALRLYGQLTFLGGV